ncbi:spindle and kinetochore-associated protein 3 isoform X2 [Dunckerocampus dactyliophorus]|uniref:spindle and kinetochore-associated protein 3 isoform X2 n=1 Tax=Dunckerocampus dactyliophorus TaxID=161453 RepID=UPI002405463A|nr:spindle and kinetochore-associated protein 3 isoform X2 [Dunckerocampus dactyliophorus]
MTVRSSMNARMGGCRCPDFVRGPLHSGSADLGQMQEALTKQKIRRGEVNTFIDACRAVQHKVAEDIQTLKGHFEKYGYQDPVDARRPNGQEMEEGDEKSGLKAPATEDRGHEEAEISGLPASPQAAAPPTFTNLMQTPRLSDFGLSEMQLRRNLAGAEWCAEVPDMPKMSLPHPALNMPSPPPLPLTPKCALRMDEDEMQTPQMINFGISEHTMCLNNDFTMDLFRKNANNPIGPAQDLPLSPDNPQSVSPQKEDTWESPEPPMFCTPGFKIKKTNGHCSLPLQGDSESPSQSNTLATTPEIPTFKTPYMNRLISTRKSTQRPEPIIMQNDCSHTLELPTPARNGSRGPTHMWEYDVPELRIMDGEDKQMLQMPNLESILGNTLQSGSTKMPKESRQFDEKPVEPSVIDINRDGEATQEFCFGTPCTRREFHEAITPEMPDLSSVTQDICKLVLQTQSKKATVRAHPQEKAEHKRCVTVVSEQEFHSLPAFLKQMTLKNLNQAVRNMNKYLSEHPGDTQDFQREELEKMTNVGIKAPVYVLCLSELKRLEQVEGAGSTAVYKLRLRN